MSEADSNLPSMTAEDEAAFKAMEAGERAAAASGAPSPAPAPAPTPEPKPTPAAPAPAPKPDDDVEGAVAAQDGKKYVPVSKFVETRQTMKGTIDDLVATNASLKAQLEGALTLAGRQPAAVATKEPEKPATNPHDPNLSPLDHVRWENEALQKRLDKIEGNSKLTEEQQQHQRAAAEAQTAYQDAHAGFIAKNPDYKPAYEWLVSKMIAMHKEGMGYPERTAVQMAQQLEWQTVMDAVNNKQNPMQRLWNMAKSLGYAPTAAAAPGAKSVADQIAAAAAAGDASIPLSGIPGGAPATASLQALVNMPKEEFAATFANDKDGEKWRKLAGG